MFSYFRRYPLSLLVVAVIFYLSFFTPPETDMESIPGIDKVVHICMYGGLCFMVWVEYLYRHRSLCWQRIIPFGILLPIAMSGCIELLQEHCTDNRGGDWLDFLANSMGVGLATLVGYYILRPIIWEKRG